MTELDVVARYPYLLGALRDCRKGEAAARRAAELLQIRSELPLADPLRRLAEWNFYVSRPAGFHMSRREFDRAHSKKAPSYHGIG